MTIIYLVVKAMLNEGWKALKPRAGENKVYAFNVFGDFLTIGVSQLAPPITVMIFGLHSLSLRAIAKLATFCMNMDVKPTIEASPRAYFLIRLSIKDSACSRLFKASA